MHNAKRLILYPKGKQSSCQSEDRHAASARCVLLAGRAPAACDDIFLAKDHSFKSPVHK
jgi:hypothetical protein